MKNLVWAPLLALVIWAGAGSARAADKNKCGCYKDTSGVCFCDKKAKCGCPGQCEPKGCEEARDKQIQKEIEAETRKAEEADRRHVSVNSDRSTGKSEKSSGGDRSSGEESSRSSRGSKSSADPPPSGKKLSAAQVKQLVKLLDQYFAESPDSRTRSAEELRNQLSQSR